MDMTQSVTFLTGPAFSTVLDPKGKNYEADLKAFKNALEQLKKQGLVRLRTADSEVCLAQELNQDVYCVRAAESEVHAWLIDRETVSVGGKECFRARSVTAELRGNGLFLDDCPLVVGENPVVYDWKAKTFQVSQSPQREPEVLAIAVQTGFAESEISARKIPDGIGWRYRISDPRPDREKCSIDVKRAMGEWTAWVSFEDVAAGKKSPFPRVDGKFLKVKEVWPCFMDLTDPDGHFLKKGEALRLNTNSLSVEIVEAGR